MGGPGPETREILLGITEEEWRRHYRELLIYAYARCRRWLWRTGGRENLPEGYSPEAVVQEAVARLYDGTRVWNHQQYPGGDPVPFLKAVIDSLIWALLSGAEHRRTVSLDEGSEDGGRGGNVQGLEPGSAVRTSTALAPDDKIYLENVERRIRAAVADRPELVELFECLLEGLKPREIAGRMGTDVKRVYALRKTFDRRTAEIQREVFGTGLAEGAKGDGR
jgi:DNA-directed RNA polymerase specialized sigma24 family protein